jgi:hypothetical protein
VRFLIQLLAAFVLSTVTISGFAQDVETSVDRSELARGETLTFTIRVFDQRQGMQLDLTPLTTDFDVLGTRTSSQIRSINGAVEAWTDYIVTLFPLTEGELEIPSLTINNVTTDPISISVLNQGPRSNQSSEELFLEIEVNKDSVYVQEQLLFSVRLFYTINGIRNPQFTELEMADSVIQLIGSPNQYEKLIDGVRYGVYEKRYVIFPQRSGPLEIPDILFRGEVTDGSSNFVFRNLNTRRVTAFIEGVTIDIKERPAAAQANGFWLPVTDLTLTESFSTDLADVRVGDSIVRTVTMTAAGLDGAVLPPFTGSDIDGVNQYPEPADIQRTFVDGNIVGTRVETVSIVPTTSGSIELPEISIPWWNVDTDQPEVSVIPATQLTIATVDGVVPAEQSVESTENIQDLINLAPVLTQEEIDEQNQTEYIEVGASWFNGLIAAAVAIVLLSMYRLVISPRHGDIGRFFAERRLAIAAKYSPENNENTAYRQLSLAVASGNLKKVREALILWCNHYFTSIEVNTMDDVLNQHLNSELAQAAAQIQEQLFTSASPTSESWSTKSLLALVQRLRAAKTKQVKATAQVQKYALPPLYRT